METLIDVVEELLASEPESWSFERTAGEFRHPSGASLLVEEVHGWFTSSETVTRVNGFRVSRRAGRRLFSAMLRCIAMAIRIDSADRLLSSLGDRGGG